MRPKPKDEEGRWARLIWLWIHCYQSDICLQSRSSSGLRRKGKWIHTFKAKLHQNNKWHTESSALPHNEQIGSERIFLAVKAELVANASLKHFQAKCLIFRIYRQAPQFLPDFCHSISRTRLSSLTFWLVKWSFFFQTISRFNGENPIWREVPDPTNPPLSVANG